MRNRLSTIANAHRTPFPALHFITALYHKLQLSEEKNAPRASDDKGPFFLTLNKHMIDAALLPEMNFLQHYHWKSNIISRCDLHCEGFLMLSWSKNNFPHVCIQVWWALSIMAWPCSFFFSDVRYGFLLDMRDDSNVWM